MLNSGGNGEINDLVIEGVGRMEIDIRDQGLETLSVMWHGVISADRFLVRFPCPQTLTLVLLLHRVNLQYALYYVVVT